MARAQRYSISGGIMEPQELNEIDEEKLKTLEGNILIAEDEKMMTDMMVELLTAYLPRCKVYGAYDGQEAAELFDQHDFSLVIIDDMMPRMDGFELVRYINSKKQNQKIMVIPGLISMEELKEFMRLGVAFVLKKPFELDFFLKKIVMCLTARK